MALDMWRSDEESCETFVQEALGYMRDGFSIVGIVEEEEKPQEETKSDGETDERNEEDEDAEEDYEQTENEKRTETTKPSGETVEAEENNEARKTERVVAAMIARVVNNREGMETFSRVKVRQLMIDYCNSPVNACHTLSEFVGL